MFTRQTRSLLVLASRQTRQMRLPGMLVSHARSSRSQEMKHGGGERSDDGGE